MLLYIYLTKKIKYLNLSLHYNLYIFVAKFTKMNIRLEQFMRAEKLNSAKLAEILQIQPSSISHLLSGRNRPGFDFISKLLLMFPDLNPDWIINGKGDMYRSYSDSKSDIVDKVTKITITSLNDDNDVVNEEVTEINNVNTPIEKVEKIPEIKASVDDVPKPVEISASIKNPELDVDKIVLFYPDNTFEIVHKRR